MMEYTVVEEYTLMVLVHNVNKLIHEGWIPFGGMVVGANFYQAMTRETVKTELETSQEYYQNAGLP